MSSSHMYLGGMPRGIGGDDLGARGGGGGGGGGGGCGGRGERGGQMTMGYDPMEQVPGGSYLGAGPQGQTSN